MCRLLGIYGQFDFWQDIVMEFRKQAELGNDLQSFISSNSRQFPSNR
jgi:hypothetical protein